MSKINLCPVEQCLVPANLRKNEKEIQIFPQQVQYPLSFNNSQINKAIVSSVSFGIKKPAINKFELKNQLEKMKTKDGASYFNDYEIEQIINNENDISELSKIINEIEINNLELNNKTLLKLLKKEGITLKLAKPNIDFYKDTQTKKEFEDIKKVCQINESRIFDLNKEEIANINNNTDIIKVIKKYFPEYYDCNSRYNSIMIFSAIKDAVISGETLEKILNRGIYPQKLQTDEIHKIVKNEIFNNIPEQNLNLLEDIKKHPKLDFLYSSTPNKSGLSNNAVTKILTKKLDKNFKLDNKKEMIDFVNYLYSDNKTSAIMGVYTTGYKYVDILTKNSNDTFDEGKKLIKFILKNNLINADSSEYLTKNSFKDTLNILERFEKNPLINNYKIVCTNNIGDLNKLADITDVIAEFSSLRNCEINSGKILDDIRLYRENNKPLNIDIEKLKPELENLEEYSKKISPELWEKMKSKWLQHIIEKAVRNEAQTIKTENVLYFNSLIKKDNFREYFDVKPEDIMSFCNTQTDISKLANNQSKMFEFLEKSKKYDNLRYDSTQFLTFDGDFDKLNTIANQITQRYKSSSIIMTTDTDNNVIFNINNKKKIIYDKNINFIVKSLENTKTRNNGTTVYTQIHDDTEKNQKHYVIKINDPVHNKKKTETIITKYYDENKNIVKTKVYKPSVIDGALDISETYPDGTIKNISTAEETENGICIEKHLTSPNGINSNVYYKFENLKEELIYSIR